MGPGPDGPSSLSFHENPGLRACVHIRHVPGLSSHGRGPPPFHPLWRHRTPVRCLVLQRPTDGPAQVEQAPAEGLLLDVPRREARFHGLSRRQRIGQADAVGCRVGQRQGIARRSHVPVWVHAGNNLGTRAADVPVADPDSNSDIDELRRRVRSTFDLPVDTTLVTCVGRLAAQKRLDDLVWAIELLGHHAPTAHLLLVGDGPERSRLEQFSEQAGCRRRIRFAGHRDDVAAIWAASDVAWLASDFEGQSNSLMEAMAAGLPVLASNIPANAELVVDQQTGHLVEVGDAAGFASRTARLFENPQQARELAQAARQSMLEHHSVEANIDAHVRLYHRLTDPAAPAHTAAGVA